MKDSASNSAAVAVAAAAAAGSATAAENQDADTLVNDAVQLKTMLLKERKEASAMKEELQIVTHRGLCFACQFCASTLPDTAIRK